jgi:signal transduction histidine kinase
MRLRLTMFYALPFLVTGALLLSVPLLQYRDSVPVGSLPPQGHGGELIVPRVVTGTLVAFAAMVVVSLVLGWLIAGRFLRPLRTITATARDISATNLHRRLSLGGRRDEFGDLADTLDDLFARLEASFASQRNFVANASHELRTPLTAERALLQVALADPSSSVDSLREACTEVLRLGEQQERLIAALLTLATGERGLDRRSSVDLAKVAAEVLGSRAGLASQAGVRVEPALAPAMVSGDPSLLSSLIANLVDNAIRHNVSGGFVTVFVGLDGGGRARIAVSNSGAVIPASEVDLLFEPFQRLGARRTSRDGHGLGLGLAIVRAIAVTHGASLAARPRGEGGLDIEITFPVDYA